jgi:hypothetical protein
MRHTCWCLRLLRLPMLPSYLTIILVEGSFTPLEGKASLSHPCSESDSAPSIPQSAAASFCNPEFVDKEMPCAWRFCITEVGRFARNLLRSGDAPSSLHCFCETITEPAALRVSACFFIGVSGFVTRSCSWLRAQVSKTSYQRANQRHTSCPRAKCFCSVPSSSSQVSLPLSPVAVWYHLWKRK